MSSCAPPTQAVMWWMPLMCLGGSKHGILPYLGLVLVGIIKFLAGAVQRHGPEGAEASGAGFLRVKYLLDTKSPNSVILHA